MQNPYNNYLKRQKQKPISNFKEKVANSLSGQALNNTTLPTAIQRNIQKGVEPNTPVTGTVTSNFNAGVKPNKSVGATVTSDFNTGVKPTTSPNVIQGTLNTATPPK